MKTNASRVRVPAGLSRQSKQIIKIIGALQTTLPPATIIHAFAQAEFMLDTVPVTVA
jgi:hypothetical protein